MRVPYWTIVWLVFCTAVACASSPESSPVAAETRAADLGESLQLRLEEKSHLPSEDLTLRFVAVIGDSRCPKDVTCFWAGDAEIEVLLTRGGEKAALRLHSHGGASYPRQAEALGVTLRLEALEPYPQSAGPPPDQDYVATLVLTDGGKIQPESGPS